MADEATTSPVGTSASTSLRVSWRMSLPNEGYKSGHKLQEIADTLNIPRGTVSDVVVRFMRKGSVENKLHT
jgi:DNA-binding MarR family transcriptional regulator